MRRAILIALLISACGKSKESPATYSKVDVHTHFGPDSVTRVIELMDQHGIDVVVNLSGGTPRRGLDVQLEAARAHPGRILVFANLEWRFPMMGPGYGNAMAKDLETAKRMGAVGVKIPKGLGIGFVDHERKLIPVDDPELDPVFEKAGELGLPVAIHTGDPVAFWQPPTEDNERFAELSSHPAWSFYGQPVPSWEELFAALERRIARHPKTTFIAVHFGNAPEYPDRVASLLDKYPNLYIDTAARIPEIGRHDPDRMRELFVMHQDRILFGTDLGVGHKHRFDLMLGSTGDEELTQRDVDHFFASSWRYLETSDRGFPHPTPIQGNWTIDGIKLPREVLRKVYGGNARRILGL